jgi:uncharacterized protein YecA (UPF0149 family)
VTPEALIHVRTAAEDIAEMMAAPRTTAAGDAEFFARAAEELRSALAEIPELAQESLDPMNARQFRAWAISALILAKTFVTDRLAEFAILTEQKGLGAGLPACPRLELPPFPVLTAPAPGPPRPRVSRNDPCPCGKGRKYKRCCLLGPEAAR